MQGTNPETLDGTGNPQPGQSEQTYHDIKTQCKDIANKCISDNLNSKVYHPKNSQQWTNEIAEAIIGELRAHNDKFKHIVTCIILQKGESGLSLTSTCYWNSQLDGNITIRWENESMYCIVNLFGIAL